MAEKTLIIFVVVNILNMFISAETIVPMCNDHNKIPKMDNLTAMDILRIKSLEQLHILSRHGTRTGDRSVLSVFPNMNQSLHNVEWQCNFTTVTARDYNNSDWISLQKNYVPNEQIIGGNCGDSQSLYKAVNQHKLNAFLIRDYYIGDKSHQLMNEQQLSRIVSDIFIENKYENNNSPFIKIISTDLGITSHSQIVHA